MPVYLFSALMSGLTILFFGIYAYLTNKRFDRILRLEQEKALKIGHDAGANWVLDMTVDDYVLHQSIRKEMLKT